MFAVVSATLPNRLKNTSFSVGFVAACEASGESESSTTDSVQTGEFCHQLLNISRPTCAASRIHSSPASSSSDDTSAGSHSDQRTLTANTKLPPMATATLQMVTSSDLSLENRKVKTICGDVHSKIAPSRPRMPRRNSRIDFQLLESNIACNMPYEKRQSNPHIRYAFYNKGFEVTAINRKFPLAKHEMRSKSIGMPNIDEYAGSTEDNNDSDNNKWTMTRSADTIHLYNLNKSTYGGSSGRDITLLPRLKIRISDEMGKRVKSSFDESSSSDEFGVSFEKRFEASPDEPLCEHAMATVATAFDPFQYNVIQTDGNFRKCKKCGHKSLCKQFTNSFQFE